MSKTWNKVPRYEEEAERKHRKSARHKHLNREKLDELNRSAKRYLRGHGIYSDEGQEPFEGDEW